MFDLSKKSKNLRDTLLNMLFFLKDQTLNLIQKVQKVILVTKMSKLTHNAENALTKGYLSTLWKHSSRRNGLFSLKVLVPATQVIDGKRNTLTNSVAISNKGDAFYFTASSTTFDFNNGFYEGLSNGTG